MLQQLRLHLGGNLVGQIVEPEAIRTGIVLEPARPHHLATRAQIEQADGEAQIAAAQLQVPVEQEIDHVGWIALGGKRGGRDEVEPAERVEAVGNLLGQFTSQGGGVARVIRTQV